LDKEEEIEKNNVARSCAKAEYKAMTVGVDQTTPLRTIVL